MKKKILILTSELTGHGHKSITNALLSRFEAYKDTVEIVSVNAFEESGIPGKIMERTYRPCVKYAPPLWSLFFKVTSKYAEFCSKVVSVSTSKKFIKLFDEVKPDLILSVHPGFVGSILNILEKNKIDIPLYVVVADLVTFSKLWVDARADMTICPSEDATDTMREWGIADERLFTTGFPVRDTFSTPIASIEEISMGIKHEKIRFLVVNGSEKPKRMTLIIETLLSRYNCRVTVICGRDKKLQQSLQKELKDVSPDNLEILGYSTELNRHFVENDILITRCGPNTIMEAVSCLIPVVSMGAIPGQEAENPAFLEKNGLGLATSDTEDIFRKVDMLLADDRKLMFEIRCNQFNYKGRNAAEKIVEFLVDALQVESV